MDPWPPSGEDRVGSGALWWRAVALCGPGWLCSRSRTPSSGSWRFTTCSWLNTRPPSTASAAYLADDRVEIGDAQLFARLALKATTGQCAAEPPYRSMGTTIRRTSPAQATSEAQDSTPNRKTFSHQRYVYVTSWDRRPPSKLGGAPYGLRLERVPLLQIACRLTQIGTQKFYILGILLSAVRSQFQQRGANTFHPQVISSARILPEQNGGRATTCAPGIQRHGQEVAAVRRGRRGNGSRTASWLYPAGICLEPSPGTFWGSIYRLSRGN